MNRLALLALTLIAVPTFCAAPQTQATVLEKIEREGKKAINRVNRILDPVINPVSDEEKIIGTAVGISGAILLTQKYFIMGPLAISAGYIIATGKTKKTIARIEEKAKECSTSFYEKLATKLS